MLPVLAGPGGGEVWVQGGGLLAPRVAALQRRHEQRAEGRAELAAVIMIRSGMMWMALVDTLSKSLNRLHLSSCTTYRTV